MILSNGQYNSFAYYYDILMSDVKYDEWLKYILELLHKAGVKHKDVLEMACGTGNIAVGLAMNGFDVTAFDMSPDMLSIAQDKCEESNTDVVLLCQDMRNIQINSKFGIILCLCDSINYITSTEELVELFKWVYNHLKDDGIFIFDINSAYKLKTIVGNNTFTYNEEEIVYIWDNYLNEETVEFYLTFFIKEGNLYRRFDEIHEEKIYENSDILEILRKCGFNRIGMYEGFTFKNPEKTSERINFVVEKNNM